MSLSNVTIRTIVLKEEIEAKEELLSGGTVTLIKHTPLSHTGIQYESFCYYCVLYDDEKRFHNLEDAFEYFHEILELDKRGELA